VVSDRVTSAPCLPAGAAIPRSAPSQPLPTKPPPWPGVLAVNEAEVRLGPGVHEFRLGEPSLAGMAYMRIVVDPNLPPGEVVLASGTSVLRLINVGKGDGAP